MAPRVLHVIYDDPANPWVGGGGAIRLREIYRRVKTRVDVTIVTGRFPGSKDEVIDGITYLRRGIDRPYPLSRLSFGVAASRLLRSADYDAAVFDFSAYSPVSLPADKPVGIMLGQLVGGTSRARWGRGMGGLVARYERSQMSRARVVCAVSKSLAEEADAWISRDATRCVAGAGVSDDLYRIERKPEDYFLYLGRFDVFQKGLDTLFEAMPEVWKHSPGLRLKVIGRGKDERLVREMAASTGNPSRIEIVVDPPHENVAASLGGAVAVVVPSRFEGFGMVAAEGMAAGAPVIASDIPALREVVNPPEGGLVFPPGDRVALADEMTKIATSESLQRSLSLSARKRAARFSWDAVAEDHLYFVNQIVAQKNALRTRSLQ